jgi:hypothetical protein
VHPDLLSSRRFIAHFQNSALFASGTTETNFSDHTTVGPGQRFAEGDLLVTSRCFPTLSSWRTRVRASGGLGTSKMVGRA